MNLGIHDLLRAAHLGHFAHDQVEQTCRCRRSCNRWPPGGCCAQTPGLAARDGQRVLRRRAAGERQLRGARNSPPRRARPRRSAAIEEELLDGVAGLAAGVRPPNTRWKSARLVMRTAFPSGPRGKKSTKAVSEVLTPAIVCTPLGISST